MRLCNFNLNSIMHKNNCIFKGIKYQLFNDFILSELSEMFTDIEQHNAIRCTVFGYKFAMSYFGHSFSAGKTILQTTIAVCLPL